MSRIFLYFFGHYAQQEIREMYGRCRSTSVASYPQCFTNVAERSGDTFTLGILNSYWMKQLVRRLAATRKPWTRFYGITVYFPLQYVAARLAITRQAAFSTNWNRA